MNKILTKCDSCGREFEVAPEDTATLLVPWRAGRLFDICRACVSGLLGWQHPPRVRTIKVAGGRL